MPKISEKKKLFKLWKEYLYDDLMFLEVFDGIDSGQKQETIVEELTALYILEENMRYGKPFVHNAVPKSHLFLTNVLPNLDEGRFKQIVRLGWINFKIICNLIRDDPVFNGPRACRQFSVEKQLIIVLYRLGSSGEGASVTKIASLFGISNGGVLQNITERVFIAILNLKTKYLYWPSAMERQNLITETYDELPYCIGYVDGTEIKLAEKPSEDAESYFSRKHIYSIKAQFVCDFKLRIRHVDVGYPGSVHDARIFNGSSLSTSSQDFFNGHEWLAGDSAYKLTKTVITPFRTNSIELTVEERTKFNKKFSQYRVRIEHCIGMLKERFNSLKELKLNVHNGASIKRVCRWVMVCAILHNILLDHQGIDDFKFDMQENINTDVEIYSSEPHNDVTSGEMKRREIFKMMKLNGI